MSARRNQRIAQIIVGMNHRNQQHRDQQKCETVDQVVFVVDRQQQHYKQQQNEPRTGGSGKNVDSAFVDALLLNPRMPACNPTLASPLIERTEPLNE